MTSALEILQAQYPQTIRLNTAQIAATLNIHVQHIRNQVSRKKFPIHTYTDGSYRYADIRDVASYLDSMRNKRTVGRPTKASRIEAQK